MHRFHPYLLLLLICPAFMLPSASAAQSMTPTLAVQKKAKTATKSTSTQQKGTVKKATQPRVATAKKADTRNTTHRPPPTKTIKAAKTAKTAKPQVAGGKKPSKSSHRITRKQKPSPSKASRNASRAVPPSAMPMAQSSTADIGKQISARSAMVMDADNGETIFAKMADNPRQPASTIKIITGLIALESLSSGDHIEVSQHAAAMPSSKIFLEPTKDYRADDLINAVLLASANDASVALAEKIAGSEEKFAHLMTLSARMWGAKNTICRTASGLTAVGQQSTARDLANLFRYAMQHDEFARRMREKSIRTSYGKSLRNHNKALWRIDGALGGKTGYTLAARQTYVGQFSRDGQTIVVAIMGSESMWTDLGKLVDYGFKKQKTNQIARAGN
jgi:D-alanyl-D-alanine carboxypeptidase (penicillin-binding protein 5/6)